MKFSEALCEYLSLREDERDAAHESEPLSRAASRRERMTELLAEMDALAHGVAAVGQWQWQWQWQRRQRRGGDGKADGRRFSDWQNCTREDGIAALERGEPWDARRVPRGNAGVSASVGKTESA